MPRSPRPVVLLLSVLSMAIACRQNTEGGALDDAAMGRDLAAADAATVDLSTSDPGAPLPALPLRTQGRFILDAKGQRLKLAAVNWYGAEEKDLSRPGQQADNFSSHWGCLWVFATSKAPSDPPQQIPANKSLILQPLLLSLLFPPG